MQIASRSLRRRHTAGPEPDAVVNATFLRPGLALVVALALLQAPAALGQGVTVDALLTRIATEPNPQPYTMTADFISRLTFNMTTGRVGAIATGVLAESRSAAGEPRRRKATIARLDLPLLLRPFSGAIRGFIVDLIETEHRPSEIVPAHDVFISEERPGGKFLIGGVRQDIVTEVMIKYRQTGGLREPAARRAIAQWLWSPTQRPTIARGGPGPYALSAVVDESGLTHQLDLFYDWGNLGTRVAFLQVSGRTFWKDVIVETSSEIMGMGRVDGTMNLVLSNHCVNCAPR